jgi:hypothetical protein
VTSSGEPVSVYVARVTAGDDMPPDSAYSKVGRTPTAFELPPGSYRIDVQGVRSSHESLLFEMRSEPRRLLVRTGKEGMSVTGTLLLGIGVLGVLGATVVVLSGTKQAKDINKTAIVVPMYVIGGLAIGAGIGLTLAGRTDIDDQKPPLQPPAKTAGVHAGFVF